MIDLEALFNERFANVEHVREDMHNYQEDAASFLIRNPFSALFVDMGLGKTVSTLTAISFILQSFQAEKVLVIAPLRVATDVWPSEIELWKHTAWMSKTLIRVEDDHPALVAVRTATRETFRILGASAKQIASHVQKAETRERRRLMRELALDSSSIHIINREQVEWLVDLTEEVGHWPYDVVIIDESSSFKDYTSHRFKALAKVRRVPGLIKRLHILTATPASETYIHLFPQIYLLDLGAALGRNITAYRNEFFTYNSYSRKYLITKANQKRILENIANLCLVQKKEDFLPRNEPTIRQRLVKLDESQKKFLNDLETHFVGTLPDGRLIEAKSAGILASMLLQIASGTVYETEYLEDWDTDDLKKVKKVHHLHDHKIDALKELYEEAQEEGRTLMVAYYFKSSLAQLQKAFPKARTIDPAGKYKKDWNSGKIPMLLIHPQSAGHGLNLQFGGSTLVFYDLIYSLEQFVQTIGRLDRQGQKNPVLVWVLTAEGTRDVDAFKCLAAKKDAQDMLFSILKRLIKAFRERKARETNDEL